ncbi:MAG: sugar phosphate nucleotidyltransferase [Bacteroidales bacterium]|nr:sugar phosphate nucleotidyltransferase [Bacteroidales bacterium]
MKLIIPMAGQGKRMRPHTLTVPKPLIKLAGKPIVERLIDEIFSLTESPISEIVFIINNFGEEIERYLLQLAHKYQATGHIRHQDKPLGTAHAISCAEEFLEESVIIAFADTLFFTKQKIKTELDSVIWVKEVDNPSAFGVVRVDSENRIIQFHEKPKQLVSNLAIVGVYYFKEASYLKNEIKFLLAEHIMENGEYQLTDALKNLLNKGMNFFALPIDEWLDCGNKDATVYSNKRILERHGENIISSTCSIENSIIIPPCYVGHHVKISNSIIGPFVSIENHTHIKDSIITKSIVQSHSYIVNANIDNSMVGNYVEYHEKHKELNVGDYTIIN